MSKYSGKCDFGDHVEIFGIDHALNSDIYIGDNVVPLKFIEEKDLIPYYPHLVSISAGDKDRSVIRLTDESYIDTQEKEFLGWELEKAKKKYRSAKRKKIPFEIEPHLDSDVYKEVWERVSRDGEKATKDGLHTVWATHCRKMLYDDMVAAGWRKFDAYLWVFKDVRGAIEAERKDEENEE